ncbi:hypothetical protein CW705_04515 [Candidatus Bathyarchaeota archaeon]|nr:MAG: hypothetical protein CW705_04515 [Candidatus Bathyarchaeota archaeon]
MSGPGFERPASPGGAGGAPGKTGTERPRMTDIKEVGPRNGEMVRVYRFRQKDAQAYDWEPLETEHGYRPEYIYLFVYEDEIDVCSWEGENYGFSEWESYYKDCPVTGSAYEATLEMIREMLRDGKMEDVTEEVL